MHLERKAADQDTTTANVKDLNGELVMFRPDNTGANVNNFQYAREGTRVTNYTYGDVMAIDWTPFGGNQFIGDYAIITTHNDSYN